MVMDVSLICQSTLNVSTSVLIFPHAKIYDVLRVGEVTHTNAKTLMNVFNPLMIVQVEDQQIYRYPNVWYPYRITFAYSLTRKYNKLS